jgi:hypothetical protein
LLRLGRSDEARQAAARFAEFQAASIEKAKAANQPVWMGYFRLAKALQILGRPAEAVIQLEKFELPLNFPDPFRDAWVFQENPAALARLTKVREKRDLIAKRILEIERSYSEPVTESKVR